VFKRRFAAQISCTIRYNRIANWKRKDCTSDR